jgi:hypothetical protein
MTNMEVANIIKDQIGGRALFMLGAKELIGTENSLQFRIGRNAKGVTHIKITLDPSDTYTVEFTRFRMNHKTYVPSIVVLAKVDDVYVEDLHSVIETHTGMYTSL